MKFFFNFILHLDVILEFSFKLSLSVIQDIFSRFSFKNLLSLLVFLFLCLLVSCHRYEEQRWLAILHLNSLYTSYLPDVMDDPLTPPKPTLSLAPITQGNDWSAQANPWGKHYRDSYAFFPGSSALEASWAFQHLADVQAGRWAQQAWKRFMLRQCYKAIHVAIHTSHAVNVEQQALLDNMKQALLKRFEEDPLHCIGGTRPLRLDLFIEDVDMIEQSAQVPLKYLPSQAGGDPIAKLWQPLDIPIHLSRVVYEQEQGVLPAHLEISQQFLRVFQWRGDAEEQNHSQGALLKTASADAVVIGRHIWRKISLTGRLRFWGNYQQSMPFAQSQHYFDMGHDAFYNHQQQMLPPDPLVTRSWSEMLILLEDGVYQDIILTLHNQIYHEDRLDQLLQEDFWHKDLCEAQEKFLTALLLGIELPARVRQLFEQSLALPMQSKLDDQLIDLQQTLGMVPKAYIRNDKIDLRRLMPRSFDEE